MRKIQTSFPTRNTIKGRYIVENVLHNGKHVTVYLVRDLCSDQYLFALYEIGNSDQKDGQFFSIETKEFKKKFVHPALPQVYDMFRDDENSLLYILMEYIQGSSLEAVRQQQPQQCLSLPNALSSLLPIMDAVTYLHSAHPPLIHGNIKPSNIIESTDASTLLINFDFEKELDIEKTIAVDPDTMSGFDAPERYSEVIKVASDIYSLGATLYTLLTGKVPIDAFRRLNKTSKNEPDPLLPINQLVSSVPESVAEIIHRAISMNSDDRFSSVEEFREILQQASNASNVNPQITVSEDEAQKREGTDLETQSLVKKEKELTGDIEGTNLVAPSPTVNPSPEQAVSSPGSSSTLDISETSKSRITRSLQKITQVRRYKQSGLLVLFLLALLITLLGSIGVGLSLWHYISGIK